jgi:chemotaxis protein MotA
MEKARLWSTARRKLRADAPRSRFHHPTPDLREAGLGRNSLTQGQPPNLAGLAPGKRREIQLNFIIGMVIAFGCMLGGFAAMGGHLDVLMQPFEFVIIGGSALGIFVIANPLSTIKDSGKAMMEAILDKGPKARNFLDLLSVLHALMRELKGKTRSEVENHFENPKESEIFRAFPNLLKDTGLVTFICDYCRLIIIGNAKTHEIEALMDEEIQTLQYDRFKPVHALQSVADGLPALGIVAAVLGIIHAMGSLDQSPELLGGLIGAALVGTFGGIFLSYGIMSPIATKIKTVRQKQLRSFVLIKQTLLAFMNGAMPQVAVEFGRKTIPAIERPTIDTVENETISGGSGGGGDAALKAAA